MNLEKPIGRGFASFRLGKLALVLGAAALLSLAVACGEGSDDSSGDAPDTSVPRLSGSIEVDGSSTVFPITEAVAEEFGKEQKNVRVTVGVSGTGGGFKRFCSGETAISNASRQIKLTDAAEGTACDAKSIQYIELPVAYDALSVVVNPQNDWASCMTVAELKKLWEPAAQGTVTRWNQVRPTWPDQPIKLFGPGHDSGTFDYFTEAVNGKAQESRGDFSASEDDNVLVAGVAGDKYALGYFGLAYLEENKTKIKAVQVDGGKGCVEPGAKTVEDGTYTPLSRPLFIYVKKTEAAKPEVKAFVDFYLKNMAVLAADVGYVKFPDAFYPLISKRWTDGKAGSMYAAGSSGTLLQRLQAP
jgi:phosphate transport system substrate-binding protein